jgi:hypothetical protein
MRVTGKSTGVSANTRRYSHSGYLLIGIWVLFSLLISFYEFGETLGYPYYVDDIDYLNFLGLFRSGQITWSQYLFIPHNEHIVPGVRSLFAVFVWISGLDSTSCRIVLTVGFALICLLLSAIAWRLTRSIACSLAVLLFSSIPANFAGGAFWHAAAMQFSLGMLPLIVAFGVEVATPSGAGPRYHILIPLQVLGAVFFPAMSFFGIGILVYCLLHHGKTAWRRILLLGLIPLLSVIVQMSIFRYFSGNAQIKVGSLPAIVRTAAMLIGLIPGRYAASWIPTIHWHLDAAGMLFASIAWILLAGSLYWVRREVRNFLLAAYVGAFAFMIIVCAGRAGTAPAELYYTSRYYLVILPPLTIHLGYVVARGFERLFGHWSSNRRALAAALLLLPFLVFCPRARVSIRTDPVLGAILPQREPLMEARLLGDLIASRASRKGFILLREGMVPIPGIHKDQMYLSAIVTAQDRNWQSRIRLTTGSLPEGWVTWQNSLFADWERSLGVDRRVRVGPKGLEAAVLTSKEPTPYRWGSTILFGKYGNSMPYQGKGWSVPENGFTWALGSKASLDLEINKPKSKSVLLTVTFWPFLVRGKIDKQTMKVIINGEKIAEWIIIQSGVQEQAIIIPDRFLTQPSRVSISFELPDAKSPAEVGYNEDRRILSIAFCKIRLSESK